MQNLFEVLVPMTPSVDNGSLETDNMADLDRMRVLSFGAGVQSTCLLHKSLDGEIEPLDAVIFADTGWEPKPVYVNADTCEAKCKEAGVPFHRVSRGSLRLDLLRSISDGGRVDSPPLRVVRSDGGRGMLRRKCTRHYKARPIDRLIRAIRDGHHVEQWFGISLDEMERMRISQHKWATYRYPLIEMRLDRIRCEHWLREHGYTVPMKSACSGCPFRSDHQWRSLRDRDPQGWADAVDIDRRVRGGLPGTDPGNTLYLHRDMVPLGEADISRAEDAGQLRLGFLNECDGLCGV